MMRPGRKLFTKDPYKTLHPDLLPEAYMSTNRAACSRGDFHSATVRYLRSFKVEL